MTSTVIIILLLFAAACEVANMFIIEHETEKRIERSYRSKILREKIKAFEDGWNQRADYDVIMIQEANSKVEEANDKTEELREELSLMIGRES